MSKQYKRNYLKNVIVRIDFASPISNIDKGIASNLGRHILSVFPILEPKQMTEGTFQINPTEAQTVPLRKTTVWNYYGRDREKTLSIGETFLYVEYKKYIGFEHLKDEFLNILSVFSKDYPEIQISRFGLRYINVIEIDEPDPTNWEKYISPDLLSIFRVPNESDEILRAFHLLSTKKDDVSLLFQYGMHNPDFPAPIVKKTFILDFDASYQGSRNEAQIKLDIDLFHDQIEKYFENSITDDLRAILKK